MPANELSVDKQLLNVHKAAIVRDYISQPRLSKIYSFDIRT